MLGAFDACLAIFLLHFAETTEDLRRMCRNLQANLVPGGRLVAAVAQCESHNPLLHDGPNYSKYGMFLHSREEPREGDKIVVDFAMEEPFSRATLRRSLPKPSSG